MFKAVPEGNELDPLQQVGDVFVAALDPMRIHIFVKKPGKFKWLFMLMPF